MTGQAFLEEHERRTAAEGFFYGFSDDALLSSLDHWNGIVSKYGTSVAREQVAKLTAELERRTQS